MTTSINNFFFHLPQPHFWTLCLITFNYYLQNIRLCLIHLYLDLPQNLDLTFSDFAFGPSVNNDGGVSMSYAWTYMYF